MTGGLKTLMSCKPSSDARISLLCFQVVRFETILELRFEILPRDAILCFAGFLGADLLCIRKETGRTFLSKTEEKEFCICGNMIGIRGE